ncbi:hypothetical protein JOM56_003179 [Amanita muscaria]
MTVQSRLPLTTMNSQWATYHNQGLHWRRSQLTRPRPRWKLMTASQPLRSAAVAYTKQNYPLHAYMEMLYVLLMKLDGVESHGSQKVRDRRKEVTRNIEREAERVEALVRDVWRRYSTQ